MAANLRDVVVLEGRWTRVLHQDAIRHELAHAAQEGRSALLNYWDIDRADQELADFLLQEPDVALAGAAKAAEAVPLPSQPKQPPVLRILRLTEAAHYAIRHLRAEHVDRLVSVDGLVKSVRDPSAIVLEAYYRCLKCDCILLEPQDDAYHRKEPIDCDAERGGCGRSKVFKFLAKKSTWTDQQRIVIQESPEGMIGGDQPRRLTLLLRGDLCDTVRVGDRIIANGILRLTSKKSQGGYRAEHERHLEVLSVEHQEQAFEEVTVSDDDKQEIQALAAAPNLREQLVRSVAPSIIGLDTEKEAILLQLFGGVEKELPDKTRIRGDIHLLLVGDPGTAKSQLLRRAARVSPRAIYASGKSSSGVGLTAAAVPGEDGQWTLEAGALVLADRGLACIDELDKMEEKDRGSIHEALEHGTISVNKAGQRVTFNAREPVLAAANPKDGRFDTKYGNIAEQIDLDPALLSRFDCIFPLQDKPNKTRDEHYATRVLDAHAGAAIRHHRELHGDTTYTAADEATANQAAKPPVPDALLRKFIAYAKRTTRPVLTPDARARLRDYWVSIRDGQTGAVPLTARQLEAVERLSEASARARLSDTVTVDDANAALRIFDHYIARIATGSDGTIDIDAVESGITHDQRNRIQLLIGIVDELSRGSDGREGAFIDDIAKRAALDPDVVEPILERLVQDGRLLAPRGPGAGYYRPLRRSS